jgi:hypothetical protein
MSYMSALGEEAARSGDAWVPGRFEVDYLAPEGAVRGAVLEDVWSAVFEDALPVRRFAARKGQQHLSGLWWVTGPARRRPGQWPAIQARPPGAVRLPGR